MYECSADIPAYAWATFVVLTILHVYFNIRAVRCLCLRSLNPPRLDALVAWSISNRGDVLTPEALAAMESLLAPPVQKIFRLLKGCPVIGIELGTPVENLVRKLARIGIRRSSQDEL